MKTHPAADCWPMLEGTAMAALVKSITPGFDPGRPVLRWRGQIVDGRNRLRACEIADVMPVIVDLPDDADPFDVSWSHNGPRRDLEPDHKAAVYLRLKQGSSDWVEAQEQRREAANAARRKKALAQPRMSGGEFLVEPTDTGGASREAPPVSITTGTVESANDPEGERQGESRAKPKAIPKPSAPILPRRVATVGTKPPRFAPTKSRARDTAKVLAAEAGVSRATIQRVQRLQRMAPDRFDAVLAGKAKANKEIKILKRQERVEKIVEISKEVSQFYGADDPRNKPGWTIDPKKKRSDYIAYGRPPAGVTLLPAELLRFACEFNLARWKRELSGRFGRKVVQNRGYQTLNVAVPWDELWRAIRQVSSPRLAVVASN